jgi:hypothetical protein
MAPIVSMELMDTRRSITVLAEILPQVRVEVRHLKKKRSLQGYSEPGRARRIFRIWHTNQPCLSVGIFFQYAYTVH